jgi:hypothetical protein
MNSTSLQEFVSRAREARRISFGDLRRLQRDILPGRLTTREDAELLLSLDRAVDKADPDWTAYLIGAVRDFVVWGMAPTGKVDQAKAEWLIHVLAADKNTKAARSIVREVIEQACEVDGALLVGLGRSRPGRVPSIADEQAAQEAAACEQSFSMGSDVSPPIRWTSSLSTSVNQIAA